MDTNVLTQVQPLTGLTIMDILSLLIQIPVVGIFIWYTLQITKTYLASSRDRDIEWRSFLEIEQGNNRDRNTEWRVEFTKRDAEWRDFLREQRESNSIALGRLAEEIKCNTQILATVQTTIASQDRSLQEAVPLIKENNMNVKKILESVK